MEVAWKATLKTLDGSNLEDEAGPISIQKIAVQSLLAISTTDSKATPEEKFKRYELARKIHSGGGDFTTEEVALIKNLIGKLYGPLVVGQAWEILEGKVKE